MAAGLGFKTFTTGEVLTAADTNGYLMQGILVFATAAARDAAITSPQEGQACYLKDTDAILTYSGSAWVGIATTQNPVINSAYQVWQRGTSVSVPASTANAYTADRWAVVTGASQAFTVSRQATGDTTNLPFIQFNGRFQRNSGQTGTSAFFLSNAFETINSIPFVGKTVTVSFYARAGANYSSAASALGFILYSGTGTDQQSNTGYTGATSVASTTATLTTTWQRFTATGTVGTSANEISLQFSYTPVGTAGVSDYFDLTGVQLDIGSVALPFRTMAATIQGELAACKYYYSRYTSGNVYGVLSTGIASNTGTLQVMFPFPTGMRVIPTAVDTSAMATFYFEGGASNGNTPTTVTIGTNGSVTSGHLLVNKAAAFVSGMPYSLNGNNSATAFIGFSSEL